MSHTDTDSFNPKLTSIWHHEMNIYRPLMSSSSAGVQSACFPVMFVLALSSGLFLTTVSQNSLNNNLVVTSKQKKI